MTYNVPFPVMGAIRSSVFITNVTLLAGTCPAGSCVWPTTPTLGFRSSCSDVRSNITESRSDDSLNYTIGWPVDLPATEWKRNMTLEILPKDFSRPLVAINVGDLPAHSKPERRLFTSQFILLGFPPTHVDQYLDVTAQYIEDKHADETVQPPDVQPLLTAYHCAFSFCIQAYAATTRAGVPEHQLVSTWDQWDLFSDDDGENWEGSWLSAAPAPLDMKIAYPSDYAVDNRSRTTLHFALAEVLADNISYGYGGKPGGAFVQAFWNASDTAPGMGARAPQIADSLTTFLRTTMRAPPDARYAPTVFTDQTFVRVRWEWLVFPLSLLLTAYGFLAATIWHTRRLRVRPWKGHRVPLLLANIDEVVRELE